MLETHVYPDGKIGRGELLLGLNLASEHNIPVLTLALDCGRLGFPFHRSMLLDFDMADLGKNDLAILDPHGWIAFELLNLWIAKTIVTIIALKSGISGFLSFLHTPEEVLKCSVHSL